VKPCLRGFAPALRPAVVDEGPNLARGILPGDPASARDNGREKRPPRVAFLGNSHRPDSIASANGTTGRPLFAGEPPDGMGQTTQVVVRGRAGCPQDTRSPPSPFLTASTYRGLFPQYFLICVSTCKPPAI
jgi:hypothetical protein